MGEKISKTRKFRNHTQLDVANALNMSRATISAIERGTVKEVGIRKYMSVCAYLGLTLEVQPKQSRPTYHQLLEEQKR